MTDMFYPAPFPCKEIMKQIAFEKVGLEYSVKQNITLIITTACREIRDTYGCDWWKDEFDISIEKYCMTIRIECSLKIALQRFETRIELEHLQTDIKEELLATGSRSVKKKIYIFLTGHFIKTRQPFEYRLSFFITPLS